MHNTEKIRFWRRGQCVQLLYSLMIFWTTTVGQNNSVQPGEITLQLPANRLMTPAPGPLVRTFRFDLL